jgi:hypothetical protein
MHQVPVRFSFYRNDSILHLPPTRIHQDGDGPQQHWVLFDSVIAKPFLQEDFPTAVVLHQTMIRCRLGLYTTFQSEHGHSIPTAEPARGLVLAPTLVDFESLEI